MKSFKHFDQIQELSKILTKIEIFHKFWIKSRLPEILTKNEIFIFFDENRDITVILIKI